MIFTIVGVYTSEIQLEKDCVDKALEVLGETISHTSSGLGITTVALKAGVTPLDAVKLLDSVGEIWLSDNGVYSITSHLIKPNGLYKATLDGDLFTLDLST